jgi:signal transduction histidine kinase
LKLYIQLLQRGQRPEKAEHYLEVLVGQAGRLEALIQDMLEMTLLDSGQALAEWKSVSLSAVIADAVVRCQSQAEASGLKLEAMPVPANFPMVKGSKSRLLQALNEVVENAVTFTSTGGQVTVEAGAVNREGEHWVTIVVRDTGPGISREEQERVFDRFYRGKLAESGHVPGTGLGLSIAQAILQAHGGRVTVESKEGEGSAFTLWLRVVAGGEAGKKKSGHLSSSASAWPARGGGGRIH